MFFKYYLKKNYDINIVLWITQNMIIEPKKNYPKICLIQNNMLHINPMMIKLINIMFNMNLWPSPLENEQLLLNKDMEKSEINTQK